MLKTWKSMLVVLAIAGVLPAGKTTSAAVATGQAGTPGAQITPQPQVQPPPPPPPPPRTESLAAAETEAKKMLLLMDRDQNGKVSKQEWMTFMEAEFNRLDKDKNGELDVRELTQSQLRPRVGFTTPRR